MRKCNKCNVELIVGDNWAIGNSKFKVYKCKECDYKTRLQWKEKNSNWEKEYNTKLKRSKGIGVYLVKYRWINFYVGEGLFYERKNRHLKHKFSKNNLSKVAKIVNTRNLERKYLSFHILEYQDNTTIRKERESHYRRELKSYLNPL